MSAQEEILLDKREYPLISPILYGRHACDAGHSCGPTTRQYWLLHYVAAGKGIIRVGGTTHPVEAGQCFIIHPYQTTYYEADSQDPWTYMWVGFTSELPLPDSLVKSPVIQAQAFASVFSRLMDSMEMDAPREAFVYGIIWELVALAQTDVEALAARGENYILQAKSFIEAYFMHALTVQQVADYVHLDRSYFSAQFKKYTGMTPQYYIYAYRMEQARELLLKHEYTPTETAYAVGYGNVVSFSHMFKQYYGKSPREYVYTEKQHL